MGEKTSSRILVAVRHDVRERLELAVGSGFSAIYCTTMQSALHALHTMPIDLVLCGLRFDDSRMFDFMKAVRADPATAPIPFIGVRIVPDLLPPYGVRSVSHAALLLGANAWADLDEWMHLEDEAAAHSRLRQLIRKWLPPDDCCSTCSLS